MTQASWTSEDKMVNELLEITSRYSAKMNHFRICEILMSVTFIEINENTSSTNETVNYAMKLFSEELKSLLNEG